MLIRVAKLTCFTMLVRLASDFEWQYGIIRLEDTCFDQKVATIEKAERRNAELEELPSVYTVRSWC